jgi:hypothetical protein
MRRRLWFVWSVMPLAAQVTGLQVTGVTHTQAILSYTAPNTAPCTIEVSESPTYAPVVHDVDGSLFPGANSDAGRNLASGRSRVVVIGKRRSDKAQDGRLYSRALAADTDHYVRVTCRSSQAVTQFRTKTIAWGDTSSEPPPFHPDGFGNYGWPSMDWSPAGRDKEYVDPMTGVKLKLMAWPGAGNGARGEAVVHADLWWDWQGAWTNAQEIRSGGTAALASTSTANAPIFVGIEPRPGVGMPFEGTGAGNYGIGTTIDDIGLRIYGSGTDGNAAHRTIQVCLSMDSGQSCHSPAISVTLPQGRPADIGVFPQGYPTPMFASWGMQPLRRGVDWPKGEGTVNVSGNTVTLTNVNTQTMFLTSWPAGTKIWIAGSAPGCPHNLCTIRSVQSASQLTLEESLNLTGATYKALNFGYRIWKSTNTGTVSVSIRKAIAWSMTTQQWAGGSRRKCSEVPTTTNVDRNGNPLPEPLKGYLCVVPQNPAMDGAPPPPLWWVSEETGESRMVAIPWHGLGTATYAPGTPNGDKARQGQVGFNGLFARFDPSDGRVFYAVMETNTAGKRSIFRIRYTGDFRELGLNYSGMHSPPLEWTNISPPSQNRNIEAQIDAYGHPDWDPNKFGYPRGAYSAESGAIVLPLNTAGQDSPCWMFIFGLDGTLIRMLNSWGGAPWDGVSDPDIRWMGCHSMDGRAIPPMGATPGFTNMDTVNGGSPGLRDKTRLLGGPFESRVIAVKRPNGWDTQNTSVSATIGDASYDSTCPPDIPAVWQKWGATGKNCLTIRIAGEPCSNYATDKEKTWWPCPWDSNRSTFAGQTLQVGDVVRDAANDESEMLLVVRKAVRAVNDIELVTVRRYDRFRGFGPACTVQSHGNGWSIRPSPHWCHWVYLYYVSVGPEKRNIIETGIYGHADTGVGATPGTIRQVGGGAWKPSLPVLESLGRNNALIQFFPGATFDGVAGVGGGLQTYPSLAQFNASGANRNWMLDNHHIEAGGWSLSMSPVPGQSYTWRMNVQGKVDIKRLPIIAWSGHYLLRDISGPGSRISDATPWTYCYAYQAGECVAGSSAGEFFVSAPNSTSGKACPGFDQFKEVNAVPCAVSGGIYMSWSVQKLLDPYPSLTRRLTMGFTGHGRQIQFGRTDSMPEGKWVRVPAYWLDGVRSDFLLAKVPAVDPVDTVDRSRFQMVRVKLPGVSNATHAVVDFGYEEFGRPTDFYCTTRRERCTVPGLAPFSYASEPVSPAACSGGCTIDVPALPQKVLYYRARHLNASGQTVFTWPVQAVAVY